MFFSLLVLLKPVLQHAPDYTQFSFRLPSRLGELLVSVLSLSIGDLLFGPKDSHISTDFPDAFSDVLESFAYYFFRPIETTVDPSLCFLSALFSDPFEEDDKGEKMIGGQGIAENSSQQQLTLSNSP